MLIPGTEIPIELHEIVILGTGLAGMAAAVAARQAGAEVLVLDKAPVTARSGNTRFSGGGFRAAHDGYDEDAVFADHLKITQGRANRELVETMIVESRDTADWLERLGVKWAHPDDRPDAAGYIWRFFYGGGQGMIEDLVAIAERLGVEIRYEHAGTELLLDGRGRVAGVRVQTPEGLRDFRADAVILATGGFQANPEMRVRYLGRFADALIVRGTRY
ncbi:MAG: FAD-dependent oxidoreductase, partial [Chloroflexi bacterium]|nr:FAD-dependent oxidoreductase [Chloroflexota bacterium]